MLISFAHHPFCMKEENSAVFRAAHSKSVTRWGIALAVVLGIPLFVFLLLGLQGPTFFVVFLSALFAVIPALVIYFTLAGRTLSYEIGKDEFRVNFRPMKLRTPYAFIEGVEIADLTLLLRLFGGSWPGLHWGLFKSNKGNVSVYATKVKGDFVVINLVDGKRIAITPAEPEAFLKRINEERNRFGTVTKKDIAVFESFSRKLIYAQIAVVTAGFFVFLAYFLWVYPALPEIVPVHFSLNWIPNRWAHKSELFWMVGLAAIFPSLNAVFALKFGKFSKGLMVFLGVVFVLVEALFFSIIYGIQGFA
jgi:hypothetical protein